MRRDAELPQNDVEYLDASHLGWEVLREGPATWLLLPDFSLPDGYDKPCLTAALRIEACYPDTQIDMVFFSPEIKRTDGRSIGATEGRAAIDGKSFQQWSRHRTPANPWRPGIDDIQSHIVLVRHWLERELQK